MSSAGQAAGYVVGGVIGAMFPGAGWVIGAQIGGMIGGYIDPPKGQNTVGPRLEDLTVQTSTYGAAIPRIKGTIAITGNVFWLEGDAIKEHVNTKKVGGKGGPSSKQTTYSYTATFAVSFAQCITEPIAGIRRLWLANRLVYDAGSDNLQSILASNSQEGVVFRFYDGRDDQQPDPRMQADKGVANVSGYPGRAYVVFYDLDLTEHYSNTLMATQAKVEFAVGSPSVQYDVLQNLNGSYPAGRDVYGIEFSASKATYSIMNYDTWTQNPTSVEFWETEYGVTETQIGGYSLASIGYTNNPFRLYICHTDRPVLVTLEGYDDGYGHAHNRVRWHEYDGTTHESLIMMYGTLPYLPYYDFSVAIDGDQTFFTRETGGPVYKMVGTVLVGDSGGNYLIQKCGLSENYLFGVYDSGYASTSTTVYKFDRTTLALVATYTQSVTGSNAAICVIDDDTFYTLAADHVYKWESGVVVDDLGAMLPFAAGSDGLRAWFKIISESPPYGFSFTRPASGTTFTAYVGHQVIAAQSAKLHDIITDECALVGIGSSDLDLSGLTNHDVRGYRHSGSVRAALEQLQSAFPFDVLQSGYTIKFKDRVGAAVLTVPESDLGAYTGNDAPARFSTLLEMPTQVPAKVTFNFLNADREYDPDEQSSAYTAQEVKSSYTVSLPLVMTPTEAKRAADVLLKKEQVERTTVAPFWLPPTDAYRKLEAADVVDVIAQGRTHTVRLTKVSNLPDGRVECEGRLTASAAYASTAEAQDSLVLGQSLVPLRGSSGMQLLDIPRIVSAQDAPGISAAMWGYTDGWPGGTLFRSDDSGQTYNAVTSFLGKTEVFISGAPIGAANGYAIDNASALEVTPKWTGADLFSITETQLYAHGNLAAYGADGRWEIVCFKTVATSGSDYVLSDFRRGLYGTEWATGLHQSGDLLVMLDLDMADFIGLPLTAINSPRLWRGVTSGAAIDSAADVAQTYSAANIKPLSPVDINGERLNNGDWNLSAKRRTRTPVELFSGLSVPLGESVESYDVEFWDAGYTGVKCSWSAISSLSINYSNAQQVADFGTIQSTLYGKAYQLSPQAGRGFPLIFTISRPIQASDPDFASRSCLIHFNGTHNSTVFTDVKGKTITKSGSPIVSTTWSGFGGASGWFGGSSSIVMSAHADFGFGTGDFCIEFDIYYPSAPSTGIIVDLRATAGSASAIAVYVSGGKFAVYDGPAATGFLGTTTIAANTRYRVAASRSGTTWRLIVNGAVENTRTSASNLGSSQPCRIGCEAGGSTVFTTAYIDELRITKGLPVRTGNYTPETDQFPDS